MVNRINLMDTGRIDLYISRNLIISSHPLNGRVDAIPSFSDRGIEPAKSSGLLGTFIVVRSYFIVVSITFERKAAPFRLAHSLCGTVSALVLSLSFSPSPPHPSFRLPPQIVRFSAPKLASSSVSLPRNAVESRQHIAHA